MNQPSDLDDDIIVPLGHDWYDKENRIDYNASEFLLRHDSSRNLIANVERITHLLDKKVHIDTNDPKYSHIYQGIDIIVKRLLAELAQLDPFFVKVKSRRTGSTLSDVKVGLPHEVDYVFELPKGETLRTGLAFDRYTLSNFVKSIITDKPMALTRGLSQWVLYGVEHHRRTGGVCLVLQSGANANNPASVKVGVTVDLVPVYIMDTTDDTLNEKAAMFLPKSLNEYAQHGDSYRLFHTASCDTGHIENDMINQLPNDTKRCYRVAKFLISYCLVSAGIPFPDIETLNEETVLRLYGRKQFFSSYTLRVLFLHLLLHVHGTGAETMLKGDLLVLCLLDMVKQWIEKGPVVLTRMNHPLIKNRQEIIDLTYSTSCYLPQRFDKIMQRLKNDNPDNVVEELNLLNIK